MSITPRPYNFANICPSFTEALYQFLKLVEADVPFVYSDTEGIPTLGIGFALLTGTVGKHNWAIVGTYPSDFSAAGISLTQTQLADLKIKFKLKGSASQLIYKPKSYGTSPTH